MRVLLVLFVYSTVFSQPTNSSEIVNLNEQLALHYKNRELAKAFTVAERILQLLREKNDLEKIATAVKNLAIVMKYYNDELRNELYDGKTSKERKSDIRNIKKNFTKRIPELFKEAIKIYEKKLKSTSLQLAEAKFEYALYLIRFQEKFPDLVYEAEKAEKLFSDALSIREALRGRNDDLTLLTLITGANFNHRSGNFERSAARYQDYIKRVETKYGDKSEFLVPAMRELAKILVAIGNEREGLKLFKRLVGITGKSETLPIYGLDLTLLNKEDALKKLIEDFSTFTKYKKKQKWVKVSVKINKKGKVVEAFVDAPSENDIFGKDIREKASKGVKKWKLKPFMYEGRPRNVTGFVWYPYL